MDSNTICIVKNRSFSRVGYTIPEDGIRREFAPGESKKIRYSELEKLSFQSGGVALMQNFLQVQVPEARNELGIHTEPEYNMDENAIIDLIRNGSLDKFLDCLDFAPVGVIDLIKKYAVDLPMENTAKIKALKEKTGFDLVTVLRNLDAEKAEEGEETPTTTRRVAVDESTTTTPGRRVAVEEPPVAATNSKYKVVSST